MAAAYLKAPDFQVWQRCRKIAFDSRQMAFRALGKTRSRQKLTQHGSGHINVYRCDICRGWHVGHLPPPYTRPRPAQQQTEAA